MAIGPTGRIAFLEIKAPGKKPSELQRYEIRKLQNRGVHAACCDNSSDGIYWLRRIL